VKKAFGILVVVGLLLATALVSAVAYPIREPGIDGMLHEKARFRERNRQQFLVTIEKLPTDHPKKRYAEVKGIWGYTGENESSGYFAGRIMKNRRVSIFRGVFNTTDNESKGKIVGIMKLGYFNGRVITENGTKYRVTGLYDINRENKTLRIRWMTLHETGWAIGKIIIPE
jgi:hypothetical protein